MKIVHRIFSWLKYQKNASSKYYLHSPLVYDFYLKVLELSVDDSLQKIKEARKQLAKRYSLLQKYEHATNSINFTSSQILERKVAVKHKYGKLLYALSKHYQPKCIVELGTSIGISTAYLAAGNPTAKVISADANRDATAVAKDFHQQLRLNNIELLSGLFDKLLPSVLTQVETPCLIYIDGNHTYDATLSYFQAFLPFMRDGSILVFDDIYWSKEMTAAWHQIKQHPQVKLTIDVYQFGICFFSNEKLAKEDFVLSY